MHMSPPVPQCHVNPLSPSSVGSSLTGHCLVSQAEVLTPPGPLHELFPLPGQLVPDLPL